MPNVTEEVSNNSAPTPIANLKYNIQTGTKVL
jgi:hypothetical protein